MVRDPPRGFNGALALVVDALPARPGALRAAPPRLWPRPVAVALGPPGHAVPAALDRPARRGGTARRPRGVGAGGLRCVSPAPVSSGLSAGPGAGPSTRPGWGARPGWPAGPIGTGAGWRRTGPSPSARYAGPRWTLRRGHLHHLSYARLGHEADRDLVPLCRSCHQRLHRVLESNPAWLRAGRAHATWVIIARLRPTARKERERRQGRAGQGPETSV